MTKKKSQILQPILIACKEGNIKKVNQLMKEKGFKINIKDKDGFTPIMFACHYGHLNIFNKLLKVKGVNINMRTYNGKTCLMLAAQKGHIKIVNKLLSLGAKTQFKERKRTKRSCRTRTAYNMARMCGHNNIVKKLSKKKMVKRKLSLKKSNNKPKVLGMPKIGVFEGIRRIFRGKINHGPSTNKLLTNNEKKYVDNINFSSNEKEEEEEEEEVVEEEVEEVVEEEEVDEKIGHPWLAGLSNLGHIAVYKKNFEEFSMMRDKIRPPAEYYIEREYTYFYEPYNFWEKRMQFLVDRYGKTKVFPRILNLLDVNEEDMENLQELLSSAKSGDKIVSLLSELSRDYGHMLCIVWHKGVDKASSNIVLHDVNETTLDLITFLTNRFPSYTIIFKKNSFTFEHCKEKKCDRGVYVNKDSCVFMSHLAAELELRNIVPHKNIITVDMQKGYAAFIMKNYFNVKYKKLIIPVDEAKEQIYSERIKLSVDEAIKQIEIHMKEEARKNSNPRMKQNVQFSICGHSYQIDKVGNYNTSERREGYIDPSIVLDYMKNDNTHFFTGLLSKDKEAIKRLVDSIKIKRSWVIPYSKGYLR